MRRFVRIMLCATGSLCLPLAARASEPAPSYPLWDGHKSIAHYAERAHLPPTKTLDLGNGVTLDLVLIPAGTFTMGTPEPKPVDEDSFHKKIVVGKAAFAAGVGVLLVLVAVVIVRAIRQRRRPQYSLGRFVLMILAASVAVLGGMHWWFSTKALAQAQAEYTAALARYQTSYEWEKPAHDATLTTPFYMGKHEVTQAQYQEVMGANPSHFKGAALPVETVSWDDAQKFCEVAQSGGLRHTVRLPTEAEWEFACRAGTNTTYNTGDTDADLDKAAWHVANSKNTTHPVGQKTANAWGVYDMHGNVWEWCQDYWQEGYKPEAAVDPQGPPQGEYRVLRGGCFNGGPVFCRSARHGHFPPGGRYASGGFRVVVVCGSSRTP